MDKFLEQIESDVKNKILSSAKGESIKKPFNKVFKEVRDDIRKTKSKKKVLDEQSIYFEIVKEFLEKNPELIKKDKE